MATRQTHKGAHVADATVWADAGPLCLDCADLGHLDYLPAGDAALTRRAKKASRQSAVVVLLRPDLIGPNRPGPKGFRDLPIGIDGPYLSSINKSPADHREHKACSPEAVNPCLT